ncbi:MAG: hypothetical protein SOY97_06055 [Candidatus Metalachnospira sp.]|nr:hypothetical protein [Candidatus Metalachnospira sp.]
MDYEAEIHRITDMLADEELLKILYTVAKTIIKKSPAERQFQQRKNE